MKMLCEMTKKELIGLIVRINPNIEKELNLKRLSKNILVGRIENYRRYNESARSVQL